jgi:hypothetical protein
VLGPILPDGEKEDEGRPGADQDLSESNFEQELDEDARTMEDDQP